MSLYRHPGTYVEEVLLPQQVESQGTSNPVGAFLGTSGRGPTQATLVSSWTEFTRYFGSFDSAHNLHFALFSFFSNGGRSAYVSRVVGTSAVKATVTLNDRASTPLATLRVDAINVGTWANTATDISGISVEIPASSSTDRFDFIVYQGDAGAGTTIVERFTDLSMNSNDPRYAPRLVSGSSAFITVTDLNSATTGADARPSIGGVKSLTSGANGNTPATSVYTDALTYGGSNAVFDAVPSSLLLNVPDVQRLADSPAAAILQAAGAYAEARGDVFVVADPSIATTTASSAITFAGSVLSGSGTTGSTIAMYYPQVVIPDPIGVTGLTRTIGAGAAVIGLFLNNDNLYGVQKAPAGLRATLGNVVAPAQRLTTGELDALNTATPPVNAIRSIPGAGVCVMGARTMRSSYSDRYINVRRTLIHVKKNLTELTEFAMFENNDERLWRQLRSTCENFLTLFWQQGGLRGGSASQAFYVKCDSTINTNSVIQSGQVVIEVGVALQTPAEFVVIRIGQIQGGASVVTVNSQ